MKKLCAVLFILMFWLRGFSLDYFVDRLSGNDNNTGLSGSPWQTISKVNGFSFAPGDRIFLNKGNTWTETLTPKTSGTSLNPITFDTYGSGAMPIFDGGNTRTNTINFNSQTNITVRGIRCINALGANEFSGSVNMGSSVVSGLRLVSCVIEFNRRSGILIGGTSSSSISYQIDSNIIRQNGDFGILGQNGNPFPILAARIWNNIIDSNGLMSLTDGRELGNVQGNLGGVDIGFNTISHAAPGLAFNNQTSHEIYVSTAVTVPAYIHGNNIFGSTNGDGIKCRYSANIYNNNIYACRQSCIEPGQNVLSTPAIYNIHNNTFGASTASFPAIGAANAGNANTSLNIYNNTAYQIFISVGFAVDTLRIKNNIVWQVTGKYTMDISDRTGKTTDINFNNYWADNGAVSLKYTGSTRSFSGWQALGFDANGFVLNPLLVSVSTADFHLTSPSPCRGTGTNIGFGTDIGAFPFATTINTPVINWTPASPKTYPFQLDATVLNATATFGGNPVPGTFIYNPNFLATPNAGPNVLLSTIFNPSDPSQFSSVSASRTITINPGALSITPINTSQTYTSGVLFPGFTTSPAGQPVDFTLNGTGGGRTQAGTYAGNVAGTNTNYQPSSTNFTFTINPASETINVSNTTVQYDSTLKTVSVTTTPGGLPVSITGAPQRYTGTFPVTVTNTDPNHIATPVTVTLTITKGIAPPVTWNPANLTYPTPTGTAQTNATDAKGGIYIYSPISGSTLSAGPQALRLDFYPSDTNLSPILGIIRNITVAKGTDAIIVSNTTQFADGTPKPITATSTHGGALTILYNGSGSAPSAPGDYPYTVTYSDANWQASPVSGTLHILSNAAAIFMTNYTGLIYTGLPLSPTVNTAYSYTLVFSPSTHINVGSYQVIATINDGIHTGADTVTMTIIQATPVGTWSAIASGPYPYVVSSGILNASTSTAGTWTYNVNVGDTLPVGANSIIGTFHPTDATNYKSITLTNTIVVTNSTAVINTSNFNQTWDGTIKYITASTTPANLDSLVVTYTGNHTDAGSYAWIARLISQNYTASPVSGTLIISKSNNYTLQWSQPSAIQQGSLITAAIDNATSTIAGAFAYNFPVGTQMNNPGTFTLIGTFTPANSNYNPQTISVSLSVYGSPFLNRWISREKFLNLPGQ